jgi:hypothetical protein
MTWVMLISGMLIPDPGVLTLVPLEARHSNPGPRAAWKRTSARFVFWVLHRNAMPPLFTRLHTYPPPLVVVL